MTFLRLLQTFFGILFLLAVGNLTRADDHLFTVDSIESRLQVNQTIEFAPETDLILFDTYTLQ